MEIKDVVQQHTLMIRVTIPVSEISKVMGESYNEIAAYMGRKGIPFASAPYAMYYNMDMEALDVEMGFPVTAPEKGEGRIRTGQIPGGRIATMIHTGPYDRLPESYTKLMGQVKEKGLEISDKMYEYYLNDPSELKPEELETKICLILK